MKFLLKQATKPSEWTNCQSFASICLKYAIFAYYLTFLPSFYHWHVSCDKDSASRERQARGKQNDK